MIGRSSLPSTSSAVAVDRHCFVLVLSHMRSRSTLLSHVLGSSPEICGHSELHRSYHSGHDLDALRSAAEAIDLRPHAPRYFLDKIVHDDHVVAPSVIRREDVRVIFLVRRPAPTLRSIVHLGAASDTPYYTNPAHATDYYCRRLETLAEQASQCAPDRTMVIDSDRLVDDADDVLGGLTSWLDLGTPLSRDYLRFGDTGVFGFGDPQSNILTGSIVRTQPTEPIEINDRLIAAAEHHHRACWAALSSQARKVVAVSQDQGLNSAGRERHVAT